MFFWVVLHVPLCGEQHSKCERATRLCIHASFVNFALHPAPQSKSCPELGLEIQQLYLGNHSELDTCSCEGFSSQRMTLFFFLLALQPPSGVVFYSPLMGFSLLACDVSWSHTTTHHIRWTPLNEWSVRRRDLYLTTHNTHNRQISMPRVGFEPTISSGERPKTYALDRAATGTGRLTLLPLQNIDLLS